MKVSYLPSGRQMERWLEAIRDIVSREASSVEDPEGVGDDPGVGHEPGVDSEVEDELLLEVALPEGDGTRGEGHLGGGQTENLRLDGEARQLPRQKLVSS